MDAFFAARGYQFIVNLAGRDRPTESFKLGRLRTLARLERTKLLWNVVAVESSSERRPAVASAFATEFLLLGLERGNGWPNGADHILVVTLS